jgi:hypothetical protein
MSVEPLVLHVASVQCGGVEKETVLIVRECGFDVT